MPPPQDRYEVNLELVTVAGTEYTMQANLSHYEDVAELEDDILCFLPTVSDLEVFGCELELLDLREQQPLSEAFRTVLLQPPQLQIVVRLCMAFHLAFPGSLAVATKSPHPRPRADNSNIWRCKFATSRHSAPPCPARCLRIAGSYGTG